MANTDQRTAMQRTMERRSAPKNEFGDAIGRDGYTPKRALDPIPTAFGMKSQSRPDGLHPYKHGQALQDESEPALSREAKFRFIPG